MAGLSQIYADGFARDLIPRSTAPTFLSSTSYAVGDYVYYQGNLYRCTTAHTGTWVASHFTAVTVGSELKAKEASLQSEIDDVKSDLSDVTDGTNLFSNTADEIKTWVVTPVDQLASDSSGKVVIIPCEANTTYKVTKNAGGRFAVGDTAKTPVTGLILTKCTRDNTASEITYTTSNNAQYLVAFVYYAVTDGNDPTAMLASVKISVVSADDVVSRSVTDAILSGGKRYSYNADISLLTNSGSGRYIIGEPFPSGNIETVSVYMSANSEVEVRLYTLDNGVLNVAFYATATNSSAGMVEIPVHKKALNPFYIMVNSVSASIYFRLNGKVDCYSVTASDSYTLSELTASHYEFGIDVTYSLIEKYSPLGKNYLFIGDSYLEGYSADGDVKSWGEHLQDIMNLTYNSVIAYRGGVGFIPYDFGSGDIGFESLALGASVPDPNTITHIVVCGGYNDAVRSGSVGANGILTRIQSFVSNVSAKYPNANIYIGMIGYRNNDDTILSSIRGAGLFAYQTGNRYGANDKVRYLNNVEWILTATDMSSDGYHPNADGQFKLGIAIKNAIITGSAPIYSFNRDTA